jgi:Integrase core domain
MGSVGDAYDNAMCESFFATLECELLDRRRFKTQAEARIAVFEFIGRKNSWAGLCGNLRIRPLCPSMPSPRLEKAKVDSRTSTLAAIEKALTKAGVEPYRRP